MDKTDYPILEPDKTSYPILAPVDIQPQDAIFHDSQPSEQKPHYYSKFQGDNLITADHDDKDDKSGASAGGYSKVHMQELASKVDHNSNFTNDGITAGQPTNSQDPYPQMFEKPWNQIFVCDLYAHEKTKVYRSRPALPNFFSLWMKGDYAYLHKAQSLFFINYYDFECQSAVSCRTICKTLFTFFFAPFIFVLEAILNAWIIVLEKFTCGRQNRCLFLEGITSCCLSIRDKILNSCTKYICADSNYADCFAVLMAVFLVMFSPCGAIFVLVNVVWFMPLFGFVLVITGIYWIPKMVIKCVLLYFGLGTLPITIFLNFKCCKKSKSLKEIDEKFHEELEQQIPQDKTKDA